MKAHDIFMAGCALTAVLAGAASASGGRAETSEPARHNAAGIAAETLDGIRIPDSKLARAAAQLVQDTEGQMLYQHSVRVYYWAALAGRRKGLMVDPELLFVAAMFHDVGLTDRYAQSHLRYEVDGANAARAFLSSQGVSREDSEAVWVAIALHTTNGISAHLSPLAALLAEGANMDLVGAGYEDFTIAQRDAVEAAHPRQSGFAEDFMQALYDSLKHRPETTQGTGLADVLAYKDPDFRRRDFSRLMRASPWITGVRAPGQ